MLYNIAILHTDNVWRFTALGVVKTSLELEQQVSTLVLHQVPTERMIIIEGVVNSVQKCV